MPPDVFGTAPRELVRSVSLGATLEMVRTVIEIVEEQVTALAAPGDEDVLREAVLRYSREVAFAAAHVYAEAAESRGAWDARLESLVLDAVLRGEADESLHSRATALGWGAVDQVAVVAGLTPPLPVQEAVDGLRRAARHRGRGAARRRPGRPAGRDPRAGHRPAGRRDRAGRPVRRRAGRGRARPSRTCTPPVARPGPPCPAWSPSGPGPRRPGRSWPTTCCPSGCWPATCRPAGPWSTGSTARCVEAGGALLDTAAAYAESGGALESTARTLFVHPNTVRYRLRRITEITGYDPTDPREGFVLRTALALGRLAASPPRPARPAL